jgi:hypothetical protein
MSLAKLRARAKGNAKKCVAEWDSQGVHYVCKRYAVVGSKFCLSCGEHILIQIYKNTGSKQRRRDAGRKESRTETKGRA